MLVFTHNITARTSYIFNLLLKEMMGLSVHLTDDQNIFNRSGEPKLAYASVRIPDTVYVAAHGLLAETGVRNISIDIFKHKEHPVFFAGDGDLPFDIFAASFYLLSRYEEYLPSEKDRYGRFQAKNALAYKAKFLQIPVINYWVNEMKKLLHKYYPELIFKEQSFSGTVSFDIDVAYAYKGRSVAQNILGGGKDLLSLSLKNFTRRFNVLTGKEQDPFDSYAYIRKSLSDSKADHLFFFLLKKQRTRYDRNISPGSVQLKELVTDIVSFSKVAIHPSYYSSERFALLKEEKKILEQIIHSPITLSRQHYLRWQLPGSFLNLLSLGITDDYSMGYAEMPGFRAGCCTPFKFYNLLKEEATLLTIHPIAYMDGSFIEDMQVDPVESIIQIQNLVTEVRKVKGNFLCIWHNHTLSDYQIYKGWRKPYEETLRLLKEN